MATLENVKDVQWAPELAQTESKQTPPVVHKMPQSSTGACDACRARKVRCLANDSAMSSKCQRCARAGRECVYTVHSKTRRRKRTDTRVKELEEKVKSLSMLLENGKGEKNSGPRRGSGQSPDTEKNGMADDDEEWSDDNEEAEHVEDTAPTDVGAGDFNGYAAFATVNKESQQPKTQTPSSRFVPTGEISPDVIDRGLLTLEMAQNLFNRYMEILGPHFPAIYFPPGTSAVIMRKERPVLFLAILAAGASNAEPTLNLALNQEILQVYANKVAVRGEKSLELVMSILISTLWYYPPDKFEELKFHQYIHMAATMALDIGLGKRPRPPQAGEDPSRPSLIPGLKVVGSGPLSVPSKPYPDSTSLESRRTILACYLACSSVSMSLRMPNMLRFTSWMNECLNVLDTSPEAAPNDKKLIAWIRIQRLVEECAVAFSLDDPGNTASLGDNSVQQMIKGFKRQLEALMRNMEATPGVLDGLLEVNYHVNNLYVHEIALHPEHDSEDFRPPFFVAAASSKVRSPLGPAYVQAITECMTSAQSAIKVFLGMPLETVRALPALLYVRIIYSSIVLIKLDVSANSPDSEIGKIVDRNSLLAQAYIENLLLHMKRVANDDHRHLIATKFCIILGKLVHWYRQIMHPAARQEQQPSLSPAQDFGDSSKSNQDLSDLGKTQQPETSLAPPGSMLNAMAAAPMPHPDRSFMMLSSFSGAPQYCTPDNSPYGPNSIAFPTTSSTTMGPDMSHPPSAASNDTATPQSTADYSSPEMVEQFSQQQYTIPMDVDPSMFNQLQGADPFMYSQDPNAWILEGTDYSNLVSVPDFDWESIPGPQ